MSLTFQGYLRQQLLPKRVRHHKVYPPPPPRVLVCVPSAQQPTSEWGPGKTIFRSAATGSTSTPRLSGEQSALSITAAHHRTIAPQRHLEPTKGMGVVGRAHLRGTIRGHRSTEIRTVIYPGTPTAAKITARKDGWLKGGITGPTRRDGCGEAWSRGGVKHY